MRNGIVTKYTAAAATAKPYDESKTTFTIGDSTDEYFAQTDASNAYSLIYQITSSTTATLVGSVGTVPAILEIPDAVSFNNGSYAITVIGAGAFTTGCASLGTVKLNAGITEIGAGAFTDCETAVKIAVPNERVMGLLVCESAEAGSPSNANIPTGANVGYYTNAHGTITMANGNTVTFERYDNGGDLFIKSAALGNGQSILDLSPFTNGDKVWLGTDLSNDPQPVVSVGETQNPPDDPASLEIYGNLAQLILSRSAGSFFPKNNVHLDGIDKNAAIICAPEHYSNLASENPNLNIVPIATKSESNFTLTVDEATATFDETGKLTNISGEQANKTALLDAFPKQFAVVNDNNGFNCMPIALRAPTASNISIKTTGNTTLSVLAALGDVKWYKEGAATPYIQAASPSLKLNGGTLGVGTHSFYYTIGNARSESVTITVSKASTGGGGGGSVSTYTFSLNFDANSGTANSTSQSKTLYSSTDRKYSELGLTMPTATRAGYEFDGWYFPGGAKLTEDTVLQCVTYNLTAHWKEIVATTTTTTMTNDPINTTTTTTTQPENQVTPITNLRKTGGNAMVWNGSADAASYKIYLNGKEISDTRNTLFAFQTLNANTKYTVGVAAVNASGKLSKVVSIDLTADSILEKPVILKRDGQTFTWKALNSASSYKVYLVSYDKNGLPKYEDSKSGVTGTSYTFDNSKLVAGTTYKLRVCAVDKNGRLGKHASTVKFVYEAPAAVTNLKNASGNAVTWRGGSGAAYYKVYLNGKYTASTRNTVFAFQQMEAGKAYTVGIAAVNAKGFASDVKTVKFTAVKLLAMPTNLKRNTLTLSWNVVSGAKSYKVYLVSYDKSGRPKYEFSKVISGTSYTFNKSLLTSGATYKLRVCAVDDKEILGKAAFTKQFVYSVPDAVTNLKNASGNAVTWSGCLCQEKTDIVQ